MKKTLIAAAALAAAGAATAQSTVTLYGRLDASVGRTEITATGALAGSAADVGMNVSPGVMSGSRWGMRGSEDLGGGMKANFVIEAGLTNDVGGNAQGGLPFGREIKVGVSGGFGAIDLGRIYTLHVLVANSGWNVGAYGNYNAWSANGAGTFGNPGSVRQDTVRTNNAINYTSPNMGGLTAMLQYAPGENGTALLSAGRTLAAGLNYANGPLGVGLVWESLDPAAGPGPKTTSWNLGGNYNFGVAALGLSYQRASVSAGGNEDRGWGLNISAPLGPVTVALEYARETTDTNAGALVSNARAVDLRVRYDLSKRTYVYTRLQDGRARNAAADRINLDAINVGLVHSF